MGEGNESLENHVVQFTSISKVHQTGKPDQVGKNIQGRVIWDIHHESPTNVQGRPTLCWGLVKFKP